MPRHLGLPHLATAVCLLALGVALLCPPRAPAQTTTAASLPGAVSVLLDSDTSHTLLVEDSNLDVNQNDLEFNYRSTDTLTAIQFRHTLWDPITQESTFLHIAFKSKAGELRVSISTGVNVTGNADKQLVITDLNGQEIEVDQSNQSCRPGVREAKKPSEYGSRPTADYLDNTIKCPAIPGTLPFTGSPQDSVDPEAQGTKKRLFIQGGNEDDTIYLDLEDPNSLDYRFVDGAGGKDELSGSKFDDTLIGGSGSGDWLLGGKGVDWLRSGDSSDSPDVLDCGDQNQNGSGEDLADPSWDDFNGLTNCEDIAYPPLPEESSP